MARFAMSLDQQLAGAATAPPAAQPLRNELAAECIGTALILAVGCGVVAASKLDAAGHDSGVADAADPFAQRQYINTAWGLAVTMGVLVSFDISGAHLNPAVTLHACIFGDFPKAKVGPFVAAQLVGAFLGSFMVTLDYVVFKGGALLSNFYCTAPLEGVSFANAFVDEVLATAILLLCISGITSGPRPASKAMVAGFVGAVVFGIGNSFGVQSGFALNPARDLGPRLCWLIFAVLYGKGDVWDDVLGGGYFWVPLVAPCVGALLAGAVGKLLVPPPPAQKSES